jgi:hypothetical protein
VAADRSAPRFSAPQEPRAAELDPDRQDVVVQRLDGGAADRTRRSVELGCENAVDDRIREQDLSFS